MKKRPKRYKKKRPLLGDPGDPLALSPLVKAYLEALEVRGFSPYTLKNLEHNLYLFLVWCEERAVTRITDVTRPLILRYQRHNFHYRQHNGNPLGVRAQQHRLRSVIGLFRWLTRENYLTLNPATEIDLPKGEKRLPRHILTAYEADRVMNQPNLEEPLGVRDRAMLEILYSTGIRRMEIVNLGAYDVDLERGTVMVRQGKGRKDRLIPVGERAVAWVARYLADIRPQLVREPDHGKLFVSHLGDPIGLNTVSSLVHGYVESSGISKSGSCHLFRHSVATLMLENGADIRWVQAMLGHENIQSTELYTHISIRKLKEIHTLTHPGATMKRSGMSDDDDENPDQLQLFGGEAGTGKDETVH
jgi:integrase/recombinase XerD